MTGRSRSACSSALSGAEMLAKRTVFAAAGGLAIGLGMVPAASGSEMPAVPADRLAFTHLLAEIDPARRVEIALGQRLFLVDWQIAPGPDPALDGLGPVYNRVSCAACHVRNGRGRPPDGPDQPLGAMLIRLSLAGAGGQGAPIPHPHYGDQLNDRAIAGVPPEGRATIRWQESSGAYADGEPYRLRRPVVDIADPAFGSPGPETLLSVRVAPPLIGLGLLEAVPEAALRALADPDDADGDGIAGRLNLIPDAEAGGLRPGRFGWTADVPTLRQQVARAAWNDIGLTSPLHPQANCPPVQTACAAAAAADGGTGIEPDPDLDGAALDRLTAALRALAPPPRRNGADPVVRRGETLFARIGCAACHVPALVTGPSPEMPELAFRTIHPYTDLLLHDLGEGLADPRPGPAASGRDWRTAPLWGIGLGVAVAGHNFMLHDGRARDVAEAILWHGGHAENAREAFRHLPAADRAALLAFIGSL